MSVKTSHPLALNGTAPSERSDAEAPPPGNSIFRELPGKDASARKPAAKTLRKTIAERIIDLADVQPPGELPLLFGRYLLRGSIHWLTASTGIGKTTLIYNITTALAEGAPLWGIECQQRRILYLDLESGDVGRAIKIERLYKDSPRVRGQLLFLPEPLALPEELPALIAFVKEQGVDLVVFDTARRAFKVKDENDNAEAYNNVIPTLDALKQAGVASLTLGHPAKNGNGSARGAGAQEDAGDVNLSLTMRPGSEKNDSRGVVILQVTKNRHLGLDIPPLYLRRVGEDRFESVSLEDAASRDAEASTPEKKLTKAEECSGKIRFFLTGRPNALGHGEIVKRCEMFGFTSSTAKNAIKKMQSSGEIEHDLESGYRLTVTPSI